MNWPVQRATALIAGLMITAAGCAHVDVQSWNPMSKLAPQRYSADTRLKMARVQEQQGQLAKARELYAELYRGNPKNADVCQRLAVVSARLGDAQQSDRLFNDALQLAPNRVSLLTDYGYAKLTNKEYATAESLLRKAVAIAPADKRAMNNLAIALGYQGKHEQALAMFRRVVPEAQAQANLAYLHVQRGEGKLAVQRYTRAVDLDKNLRSAAHALLQLAEMEQRYLESERGRQQVARLKKKLDAKKPVAESSRSKPERQGLQIVAASGTNPSAAKQAGPTTQASPTTATSALSKHISISSRREVVKRPATPTPSVNAEPKPATKGTPAASDPWSRVARQEQRQEPKPDPVRPVVHETTAPFAPPRGIAAPSGQRRPAARPVSNDSAPLSIVPDARTHRPPAFPETQRVQEPMPEVQPRRQVATTDEVQPSKQPGKPVARPFSKIAQPSEAPAARPEPKPPTQSWMPSQQRRRLTRWHTSQRGDSAAADADAANPRPFVGVRSDRLQPVEGALKKPAAASRYEPPATSTGRVKLVPAASPEPARIRLQPAAGPPASGRVRLTPDEPRS